uniref:BRCT domain-containing protein n=1 Tax=Anopheles atroparvus TaxID=41427 RepID=A0AAG5CVL1_ANOAO
MQSQSSIVEQQLEKLYFVLRTGYTTEADASEDMKRAYSNARDYCEKLTEWITEADCMKLEEEKLTKKHVFVFEKFTGLAFERVRKAPSTIIGPRCLLSCFLSIETIPLGVQPVYTTAMRNLTVCSSGLKAKEKASISQLVFYMGGYYLDVLNATCTHLVSSTVKSVKYEKAAEIKLPIMHPDWVQRVWEESQRHHVHATDACFLERHRLPVFHALTITSTGLTATKKNEIKSLIEANGGVYAGAFKSEVTDILILEKGSIGTAKFQGAVRSKKECLSPEWIVDSAACGYALPIREYEVKSLKASTPTKSKDGGPGTAADVGPTVGGRVSGGDFNPDCTQLSEISHANFSARNVTINESIMSIGGGGVGVGGSLDGPSSSAAIPRPSSQRYREILSRMTVQQAKKAGPVLDGCNVFLSGFTAEEKEKLNKILNALGAVRYDEISATISHVIVGEQNVSELGQLRDSTAHLLTLEWLAKSIELRQLAPEDAAEHAFRPSGKGIAERAPEPPSPSSKKNLERMNSSVFKRPEVPKFKLDVENVPAPATSGATANIPDGRPSQEDSIMLQYMEKNLAERLPQTAVPEPPPPVPVNASGTTTSQTESELESQYTEFMLGKTLFVFGFSDEDAVQIITDVKYCGGTIVDETYSDEVDYIVLPTSCIGTPDFQVKGRETVNCIWLETCVQDGQCYPMEYYFAPIPYGEDDPRPLEGETIVISSYSGPERSFLIAMGGLLGASVQERLVRKAAPLLVCKEASGAKYNAAIQWDLTVVQAEWLRECARTKRRVAEGPFLVGDSICSGKNVPEGGGNPCLPTTSTDEVDIESVREEPGKVVAADETTMLHPQASSTMKPRPKPSGAGDFRYILEQKTREETDLQYGFKRLSTPELRKMNGDERMVYSQELDQYEELIVAQRAQRKPFNPNEGAPPAVTVTGALDSPTIPRNRRLSALTGASSSRSPATPGPSSALNSTSVTPLGLAGGGEYEALSVTQRVADFETPVRETLYRALKEEEEKERNASPRTRRMKELLATPHGAPGAADGHIRTPTLPECMTKPVTPYGFRPDASPENHAFHKRKLQHWDRFHKPATSGGTGEGSETASQKERRMSTPLSEIKRRFWRENLGDEYVDYIESKYTTQSNVQSLNRSGGDEGGDDEVAGTQQSPKDPSPAGFARQPLLAASGKDRAVFDAASTSRRSPLDRGNVSAEKRSRSELDDDEAHDRSSSRERSADESSALAGGQPEEGDGRPVAKKPLLSVADDEYVRRLSDVISAARESAKKKAKNVPPPEQHFTEHQEPFDSEIHPGVGGVIWRDRDIENVQINKTPARDGASAGKKTPDASPAVHRGMKHRGTPTFAISGVQEEVRVSLAQKIEQLQGRLAPDPNRYDPACTHILCGKPNRGEKMLSGIAAGKWILSTKYLDDSHDAGYFLDEESYEWGNPKAAENLAVLATPSELETASAVYTWRKRISTDVGKHDGAFTGFRVLLVVPKKDQFVRLLQSGGGFVVDCEPPFINSERAMSATHCFVDRKLKLPSEDHRALAEAGIAVLSIMYLNAYLTSTSLPDPNNFQLPL